MRVGKQRLVKPTAKPIRDYYAALDTYRHQGVSHEMAVRSAFQSLLAEVGRSFKWDLIAEQEFKVRGKRVRPDATLRDTYHLPRGHWEAKDEADDLNTEIAKKTKQGYPLVNTIFWTPERAVLFQEGRRVHDGLDITEPGALCDLLNVFFSFAPKPIVDFEEAVEEFVERVPEVGTKLAAIIKDAHATNKKFKEAFAGFFELCRTSLNPDISREALDRMLVQHLLTERLFRTVFNNPDFTRRNVIAAEVEKVIDALTTRSFSREEFLKSLDRFYVAIERAAEANDDFSDKQHFLNSIYERFFQNYDTKTADTHGIVYTPQEIVDFMCESVQHVLKEEFGKQLGDDGVVLLDPCTGTGNFVVNLMRRAAGRGKKYLQRMYREQLFANEIMLMPYYIAALNIEHEFFERTGENEPFEGLCFVDTLDLAEARQMGMFTERNLERVDRQKKAPITVVIGNPPYNVGQMVHNEKNQNRKYNVIDQRIKHTYAKASKATSVSKLNDPYVKFFRWATDRLGDRPGIVCFVSNNAFIENIAYDGMRKHLMRDFQAIYHLDLEGNVRQNPTLSGTQYNVFGIQVGVGITIAVKHPKLKAKGLRFAAVSKTLRRREKLAWIERHASAGEVRWKRLSPDERHTWLRPANGRQFSSFISIASKEARSGTNGVEGVIFKDYSLGIASHRDGVVYDFSRIALEKRVKQFIEDYNMEVDRWKRRKKGTKPDDFVHYDRIAWDDDLKRYLESGRYGEFSAECISESFFRTFSRTWVYFDRLLVARVYGQPGIFPPRKANRGLCVPSPGHRGTWCALAVNTIPTLSMTSIDSFQTLPFYLFDENGSHRRENITDWALKQFREHYKNPKITKWDIFHYVYGVLHHPGYREKFADNLKRELPRIPFAPDLKAFVKAGERLVEIHLGYDDEKVVKPYKLKEVWAKGKPMDYRVEKMRLSEDKASLAVNQSLTLEGIPGEVFEYRLGNRSALDWVIDQYQVSTDKRSGITSDPNAWGEERDDEEYIVRLVKQVVTVSLETVKIVKGLPGEFSDRASAEVEKE
jgi:predicted helicase